MCPFTGFLRFRGWALFVKSRGSGRSRCLIKLLQLIHQSVENTRGRWVDLRRVHELRSGFILHPLGGSLSPLFRNVFYPFFRCIFFFSNTIMGPYLFHKGICYWQIRGHAGWYATRLVAVSSNFCCSMVTVRFQNDQTLCFFPYIILINHPYGNICSLFTKTSVSMAVFVTDPSCCAPEKRLFHIGKEIIFQPLIFGLKIVSF